MRRDLTGFLLSPLFLLSLRKQICPTPPHPQARDAAHNKEGAQHSWGAPECCPPPRHRTLGPYSLPSPLSTGCGPLSPFPTPNGAQTASPACSPTLKPLGRTTPQSKSSSLGGSRTHFSGAENPHLLRGPGWQRCSRGSPTCSPPFSPSPSPPTPLCSPPPLFPTNPNPPYPPGLRRRAEEGLSPHRAPSVCPSVRRSLRPFRAPCALPPPPPQPLLSRGRRGDWFPARCGSERRSFVCSRLSLTRRPPLPPGPKTARPAPSHRPPPHPPSGLSPPAVGAVLRSKPRRQRSADPPRLCTAAPSASGAAMVDGVLLGSRWGGWGFAGVGVSPEEGEGRRWAKRGERSRVGSAAPCSCWPRARAERGDRSRSNASLQTVGLQNWRRCSAGGEVRRMGAVAAWPCSTCSVEASLQKEEGNSPG